MTLYLVSGQKKFGMKKEFEKEYADYKIAEFEYRCLEPVCSYVTLYENKFENQLNILKIYVDK